MRRKIKIKAEIKGIDPFSFMRRYKLKTPPVARIMKMTAGLQKIMKENARRIETKENSQYFFTARFVIPQSAAATAKSRAESFKLHAE